MINRPALLKHAAGAPAARSQGLEPSAFHDESLVAMQPVFYSEEHLVASPLARGQAQEQEQAPSIVRDLLRTGNPEERKRIVRGALRAIGFEWLGYGTVTQQRGHPASLNFFTSYAHPAWVHRYFTQRYHEVDTRHRDAPRSSLPLIWDIDELAKPQAAAVTVRQRHFLDDFRDSGIRSGIFFRLTSPTQAHEHTVISLMSGSADRSWITDAVLGQALILSLSVHEYLSRHVRLLDAHTVGRMPARQEMSATQQHILEQLQQGRSDKEIAYRLQLSSHTVDYHMRQLRQRFGVRNRVQLVNAALQKH
jgi:DNA-binding CsgD family transcriptional regulator